MRLKMRKTIFLWHMVEQGIGGVIVALVYGK